MIRSLPLWKVLILTLGWAVPAYAQLGDIDGDGVPTVRDIALIVEHLKGTAPLDAVRAGLADLNQDGVVDSADVDVLTKEILQTGELEEGVTLLDGLMVETGVVASVPTSAPALDVAADRHLAVTANGGSGITIFRVISGQYPTRIAEIDTPGRAVAVAMSGDYVAVADDDAGLAIVDVTNPEAIVIRHQLLFDFPVIAVAAYGSLGFAGTADNQVHIVDLASGAILGEVSLPGSGAIQDIAVSGEVLYALQLGQFTAMQWYPNFAVTETLPFPNDIEPVNSRLRLFAGSEAVYSTWNGGFNRFLTILDPRRFITRSLFESDKVGWKQLVMNGSGLAVVVMGTDSTDDGANHLALYKIFDEEREYLTTLATPGSPVAVSIHHGLAYVANTSEGFQLINYLPYDQAGVAPTIELRTDYGLQGREVVEGSLIRLTAVVSDDVQVRNVEFYQDGLLVGSDGNEPFGMHLLAPSTSAVKTAFKVKARATDTGGNATWTPEFSVGLLPDRTPPAIITLLPDSGSVEPQMSTVSVRFSESISRLTLTTGLSLHHAGADKTWGTPDDSQISAGDLRYGIESYVATLAFSSLLPTGHYQIRASSSIRDIAGNALLENSISDFIIPDGVDRDQDGVPDDYEFLLGLDPTKRDSDNNGIDDGDEDFDVDGISNADEIAFGTRPERADTGYGDQDRDFDGLTEIEERENGTDPLNADSDGDGFDDGGEVADGTDPLSASSSPLMVVRASRVSFMNALLEIPEVTGIPIFSSSATYLNGLIQESPSEFAEIVSPVTTYDNHPE